MRRILVPAVRVLITVHLLSSAASVCCPMLGEINPADMYEMF
jgi:hypothetical protein